MTYRGFTITPQRGGFTVTLAGETITSQPSVEFCKSFIDIRLAREKVQGPPSAAEKEKGARLRAELQRDRRQGKRGSVTK